MLELGAILSSHWWPRDRRDPVVALMTASSARSCRRTSKGSSGATETRGYAL